jgi:HUS1 checkpoint protein
MHGSLKLSISTDALNISSLWTGLNNPELDPGQIGEGEDIDDHPSARLKAAGPDAWATVRIDGRDWGKVLSVGRLGGRVIACKNFILFMKPV